MVNRRNLLGKALCWIMCVGVIGLVTFVVVLQSSKRAVQNETTAYSERQSLLKSKDTQESIKSTDLGNPSIASALDKSNVISKKDSKKMNGVKLRITRIYQMIPFLQNSIIGCLIITKLLLAR